MSDFANFWLDKPILANKGSLERARWVEFKYLFQLILLQKAKKLSEKYWTEKSTF